MPIIIQLRDRNDKPYFVNASHIAFFYTRKESGLTCVCMIGVDNLYVKEKPEEIRRAIRNAIIAVSDFKTEQ